MTNILISTWLIFISVYAIKVYIGYKLMKNNDSILNEELFPKGFISIIHIRILNSELLTSFNKNKYLRTH